MMRKLPIFAAVAASFLAFPVFAVAADGGPIHIVIEKHVFTPSEIKVPAGKAVELLVENRDTTPEEFESIDLKREKVIPGGAKARIRIGPLEKGTYTFVGEFHEDTAKGKIIAE